MDHENILHMQDNAERESIDIVNRFTEENKCPFMRYSLLWTAFHSMLNRDYEMGKSKRYPLIILGSSRAIGNYFINWGVQNNRLKQMFRNKGINCLNLRLTSGRMGLRRGNTLYIPLHTSTKKTYIGKKDMDHNFSILMENMSYNEQYFRNIINRILKINKPRFIMMNEDRTKFARLLVEEAHKEQITVFVVQHGMTPAVADNHIPFANESFAPLNADYICVWGELAKKYLIENGVNSEQIIITGSGAIDCKGEIQRNNKIIIIDQQFLGQREEMEYTYGHLVDALDNAHIDYSIYLRGTYNEKYLKNISGERIRHWEHGAIGQIMSGSRAVIGFYSTAIIEAALQNTRVLAYDALQRGDVMHFGNAGIEVDKTAEGIVEKLNSEGNNNYDLKYILQDYGKKADKAICDAVMGRI